MRMSLIPLVTAHGLLNKPRPRGCLSSRHPFIPGKMKPDRFPNAPIDRRAHFPAGSKTLELSSGRKSQERAYKGKNWSPFKPLDKKFKWRASVCGDALKGPFSNHHIRSGKFYHDGKISEEWVEGSVIDVSISITAHHNGFVELHICDVTNCGGEISQKCFRNGHCKQLERAGNPRCDNSTKCGAIDSQNKGRWYLPCENAGDDVVKKNRKGHVSKFMTYGGTDEETMKYKLPHGLTCEHCVLQWFWTSANICNPDGVTQYFTSGDRPKSWGDCPGQGGAKGGWSRNQQCGVVFPEEYLMCADVKINPKQ